MRDRVAADNVIGRQMNEARQGVRVCSADQMEFLGIIEHLTDKSRMDPALLYESPFTDIDPMGVNGVFSLEDAKALIGVLDDVRRNAAA